MESETIFYFLGLGAHQDLDGSVYIPLMEEPCQGCLQPAVMTGVKSLCQDEEEAFLLSLYLSPPFSNFSPCFLSLLLFLSDRDK